MITNELNTNASHCPGNLIYYAGPINNLMTGSN